MTSDARPRRHALGGRDATGPIAWPDGRHFAWTVFDDTDRATLDNVRDVYAFLADCGLRTTKSVWIVDGDPARGTYPGQTCADPRYLEWLLDLQRQGFEIGWHGATWHGSLRDDVIAALDRFAELFGHAPKTAANHSQGESIYWGDARLSGIHVPIYNLLTRFRERGRNLGHVPGDPFFWGDVCRQRIKYYRNFVFQHINTLKACPWMPYHDPDRPFVRYWYASSEGAGIRSFNDCLSESNQDRLEAEGGACIMYTHFANDFIQAGKLNERFKHLLQRLSRKNGWFVPVGTLLDYLLDVRGHLEIDKKQRASLERRWLWHKIRAGTT